MTFVTGISITGSGVPVVARVLKCDELDEEEKNRFDGSSPEQVGFCQQNETHLLGGVSGLDEAMPDAPIGTGEVSLVFGILRALEEGLLPA